MRTASMPAAKAKGQRIRAEHVRAGTRSAARVAEFMEFGLWEFERGANVCYWHLADIDPGAGMFAFRGEADIPNSLAEVRH